MHFLTWGKKRESYYHLQLEKTHMKQKVEYYVHNLNSSDISSCVKVLRSLFLSTGNEVEKFEKAFAHYLSMNYVVGTTSCTDSLFLCLKGLGVKKDDEVITSPLSFVASAHSIVRCGAKPVFVDVEESTANIDVSKIESKITKNTKVLVVVHMNGYMCDMKRIHTIAKKHKLKVIEDAAHCVEGMRDGVRPGHLSDAACFSFYAVKNITSAEGGAVATNSKKLYEWLMKARQHGMSKNAINRYKKFDHYDVDILGYKANMNNVQASLLLGQLERIEKLHRKKEKIARKYDEAFENNPNISLFINKKNMKHARHLYAVKVDSKKRDYVLSYLQSHDIGIAVHFKPIHMLTYYRQKYGYKRGDFPIAEKVGSSVISLPFYPKLRNDQTTYVISTLVKALN